MERCKKCIMPSDYSSVQLDEKSICNLCNSYKSYHSHLGKDALSRAISVGKNGSKYNCIVPISGGKDSMFILYYVVKELGLKPLAVNYDSGWQSDIAIQNVVDACEILNVDCVSLRSRFTKKLVHEVLLIGFKQGTVPQYQKICKNCETILRSMAIKYARKHNIGCVIWGSSALESGTNEQYINYKAAYKKNGRMNIINKYVQPFWINVKKFVARRDRISKAVVTINNILFGWRIPIRLLRHAIIYNLFCIAQRIEMRVPLIYSIRLTKIPSFTEGHPKFIHFFDYIEWDSMRNIRLLKENIGWNHPQGKEDRFDCLYHVLPNYYSFKENKITADGINYCNYIRENKLTREEALERENELQKSLSSDFNQIIEKVGLSKYKI